MKLFGLLAGILLSGLAVAAPDEEALGKWQGYPVCQVLAGDELAPRCLVGLFSNYDKAVPSRRVAHGAKVLPLKRAPLEVPITYKARSREEGKKLTALDGLRVLRTLVRCRIA